MKKYPSQDEVINFLKAHGKIQFYDWNGRRYSMDYKTVRSDTIDALKKKGLIESFRYKANPLTGFVKLKVKE